MKAYQKETGKKAIIGVRSSESALRKSQYKSCFTKNKNFTPIHDLSDELLEAIIKKYNIEVPKVYEHINRTGCMGCPYGSRSGNIEKELSLVNENQRKFVCEYFKESYEVLGINTNKQTSIYDFI
jgi:3'-phosphoadenosine 5'-phosphosulfate sulfotransferase (PAPS reductase)/FAD synthetase